MSKKLLTVLALVVALSMLSLAPATAGRTRPLVGQVEVEFNLGIGTGTEVEHSIAWAGTVEFDGTLYGIVFYPTGAKDWRHLRFFTEDWELYPNTGDLFVWDSGVLIEFNPPGNPLMTGSDRGVTNMETGKYWALGRVTNATEPFADRDGRRTFGKGLIEFYDFGAPHYAPGILVIR